MTGADLKTKRVAASIPGRLVCVRAKVDRSRLSHIERGYIQPSEEELSRLRTALDDLIVAKEAIRVRAAEVGWPPETL